MKGAAFRLRLLTARLCIRASGGEDDGTAVLSSARHDYPEDGKADNQWI
jgi:hypothetical protein